MPERFLRRLKDLLKKENIKSDFITGLVALGPLVLTVYVIVLVISWLGKFSSNAISLLPFGHKIPAILNIIISLLVSGLVIYLAGLSVRLYFGHELENFINRVMSKIPIVNTIYKAARQLIMYISSSQERKITSGKVVLFTISDNGPFLMGIVTREKPLEKDGKKYYMVFSPTTPNPTTGFYFIIEEERLAFLDIDFNDAFKIIMTSGIGIDEKGGEKLRNGLACLSEKAGKKN